MTSLLLAQSLLEYTGVGSTASSFSESIGNALARLIDGLRDVDRNTWLAIGGVLLVLAFLTRRKR
ncbi:MAG: hypothetical protein ABL982_12605 [Vicinamibacterales bacterium]